MSSVNIRSLWIMGIAFSLWATIDFICTIKRVEVMKSFDGRLDRIEVEQLKSADDLQRRIGSAEARDCKLMTEIGDLSRRMRKLEEERLLVCE